MPFEMDLHHHGVRAGASCIALHELDALLDAVSRLSRNRNDFATLAKLRAHTAHFRATLQFYRDPFGPVASERVLKRLRKLLRRTRDEYDACVAEGWLSRWSEEFQPGHYIGRDAFLSYLREIKAEGFDADKIAERIAALNKELHQDLSSMLLTESEAQTVGEFLMPLVRDAAQVLRNQLACVQEGIDEETIGSVRSTAERIRFMIEPLSGRLPMSRNILDRLYRLEEVLGAIRDLRRLAKWTRQCARESVGGWAMSLSKQVFQGGEGSMRVRDLRGRDPLAGLLHISDLAGRDQSTRFESFRLEWTGGAEREFFSGITAFTDAMGTQVSNSWIEPTRVGI